MISPDQLEALNKALSDTLSELAKQFPDTELHEIVILLKPHSNGLVEFVITDNRSASIEELAKWKPPVRH